MRTFNYSEIKKQKWDSDVLSLIAAIYKEAGKQEMYLKQRPEELEKLVDLIYQSNEICFAGNFFTQSVSMQLQIELSYLGKKCTGMYPFVPAYHQEGVPSIRRLAFLREVIL